MTRPPLLLLGELSNRVYLVTRYRTLGNGVIEATGPKIDVTDQVGRVLAELDARGMELRPVAGAEAVGAPESGPRP